MFCMGDEYGHSKVNPTPVDLRPANPKPCCSVLACGGIPCLSAYAASMAVPRCALRPLHNPRQCHPSPNPENPEYGPCSALPRCICLCGRAPVKSCQQSGHGNSVTMTSVLRLAPGMGGSSPYLCKHAAVGGAGRQVTVRTAMDSSLNWLDWEGADMKVGFFVGN